MSDWVAARVNRLLEIIMGASGWGSVTLIMERGRVARIVWSVDEKITQ